MCACITLCLKCSGETDKRAIISEENEKNPPRQDLGLNITVYRYSKPDSE
jgi:hypothetical protein